MARDVGRIEVNRPSHLSLLRKTTYPSLSFSDVVLPEAAYENFSLEKRQLKFIRVLFLILST